ncbi:MAG: hypothetical protein AAGB13_05785 [Cyanobacteria bacterium P01_F01_bin.33]
MNGIRQINVLQPLPEAWTTPKDCLEIALRRPERSLEFEDTTRYQLGHMIGVNLDRLYGWLEPA